MAKQTISLAQAHEQLAELYKKRGDLINAFKEYNSLTKISPYWSINFRKAADCLLHMNDLPRALYYFERSTEYGSDVFYAHYRAGEILIIKNDLESALSHFRKAQEIGDAQQKQKALIRIYQTLCYLNRPEEGKDIKTYFKKINPDQEIPIPSRTTYLDYNPLPVEADLNEAKNLIKSGSLDKAIGLLEKSLDTEDTPLAYRLLGELYLKKGVSEKSHEFLAKAYKDFEFESRYLHYYIISCLTTNNKNEAVTALAQLKKIDPNYSAFAKLQRYVNAYNPGNSISDYDLQ
jgi:tetratricopeptide (TPR) repeat protein